MEEKISSHWYGTMCLDFFKLYAFNSFFIWSRGIPHYVSGYLYLFYNVPSHLFSLAMISLFDWYSFYKGGTVLGSSRCLPFKDQFPVRTLAVFNLLVHGIDRLIVIGGDGSLSGKSIWALTNTININPPPPPPEDYYKDVQQECFSWST